MKANRKKIRCQQCGREMVVGAEAVAGRCWSCTGFVADPPLGGKMLEQPKPSDIQNCANLVRGKCLTREHKPCVVMQGDRCGWFEKAVQPSGQPSGRVCRECGAEVPKRHRYCDSCQQTRRRNAYRESKRQNRASCPHLAAPTPLNC